MDEKATQMYLEPGEGRIFVFHLLNILIQKLLKVQLCSKWLVDSSLLMFSPVASRVFVTLTSAALETLHVAAMVPFRDSAHV